MRPEIRLVLGTLVLITGSKQEADLSRPQPTAPPSVLPFNHESSEPATTPQMEGTAHPESPTSEELTANFILSKPTVASQTPTDTTAQPDTPSFSAVADSLSSTLTSQSSSPKQALTTGGRTLLSILLSQSVATMRSSTAPTFTQSSTVSAVAKLSTKYPQTTAPGQPPAGPTHQDAPSELNVGDEDLRGFHLHKNSPLDPLLAGLLSVFIVTTAVVFIALFLKFRQRMNHPEFHRLQDLPMDDLMEDTPLSRYSY